MKTKRFTLIISIISCAIALWIGSNIFSYFTHNQKPHLILEGLQQNGSYKSNIKCSMISHNDYKVDFVTAKLDGQEFDLDTSGYVRSKNVSIPFNIDTTTLSDGKHTIEIEAIDSSYHQNKIHKSWNFIVDNVPLKAALVDNQYSVSQGKTLHIKIQTNKKLKNGTITFLSRTYKCYSDPLSPTTYECFIPIKCEENTGEQLIITQLQDAVENILKLTANAEIIKFTFKKQNRRYNMAAKLDEERDISMNSKILESAIEKWTKDSPDKKLWCGPFEIPTQTKKIITPHGEIRVTPERGRYMHKGVDLINTPRSVVWSSQNGKVVIKDRYLLTGNTVVIDHGLGVTTLYAHLEDYADIEVGDIIKKGNPIGRLGQTGYATGYHLHWELRVNGLAVDPIEWTKKIY